MEDDVGVKGLPNAMRTDVAMVWQIEAIIANVMASNGQNPPYVCARIIIDHLREQGWQEPKGRPDA